MIPGINLLSVALGAIGHQAVMYRQNTGRTTNAAGFYVGGFAPPARVAIGSVQAVPRQRYMQLGLDLAKTYVTWFVPRKVIGLERGAQGDQFDWNGGTYQIESTTEWHGQDGWTEALAVKVTL